MALSVHVSGNIKHYFEGQGDDGEDICCSQFYTVLQQMSMFASLNSKDEERGVRTE